MVWIFEAYVHGASPQRIAAGLNRDAVPWPSGGVWNASNIAGNAKRGKMNLTGPGSALSCHNRTERGVAVCENSRTPAYAGVGARVLAAIQEQLLHPDVVEAAKAGN